jgi:RNA polymerase sigma-70 factor (ECF subfamily)
LLHDQFKHTTDQQLLQFYYADHNNEWLGILLQRYSLMLLGVCMKYLKQEEEAKDAVQQVYMKVLGELPKYKVEYFKSWVYMIAKNHCLMSLRDKGRYKVEINEHHAIADDEQAEIKLHIEKDRTLTNMEKALLLLNKEQQQCVTLFYLEKKSYQEITDHTGYNLLQVKSYIQNGKRNLKLLLEKMNHHES